jgi:hypothetical protein
MEVLITYRFQNNVMNSWFGTGTSKQSWPTGQIETDIGTIVIYNKTEISNLYHFEFIGKDEPKGSFLNDIKYRLIEFYGTNPY